MGIWSAFRLKAVKQTIVSALESGSSRFQLGEGPSRGLLHDYEPLDGPSFQALMSTLYTLHVPASSDQSRTKDTHGAKYFCLPELLLFSGSGNEPLGLAWR